MDEETMTGKMVALMDAREEIWRQLELACPALQGASWKVPLGDLRTCYWRYVVPTGGGSKSLVYSWSEEAVTSKVRLEDTSVVTAREFWRPHGQDFVMLLVDDSDPGRCRLVVLWATNEREVEA